MLTGGRGSEFEDAKRLKMKTKEDTRRVADAELTQ